VEHRHRGELCRRLVLWAWTRKPDQVEVTSEAEESLMTSSIALTRDYTDLMPLIDRGSIKYKLLRLAASLACRTFSCARSDPHKVVVRSCHVEHVTRFLDRTYSSPEFGYRDYSRAVMSTSEIRDADTVRRRVCEAPFASDLVEAMLNAEDIDARDFRDWCGWQMEDAVELLSLLVRKHALVRERSTYKKTPAFIALLKGLRGSDELKKNVRPDWIKDERSF
jgi:hypothetical protein